MLAVQAAESTPVLRPSRPRPMSNILKKDEVSERVEEIQEDHQTAWRQCRDIGIQNPFVVERYPGIVSGDESPIYNRSSA